MSLIINYIELYFVCFTLGAVISYAWWCRLRVIAFREDLYEIRDRLWDAARKENAFGDPDYMETRELIHMCIRGAAVISMPTMLWFLRASVASGKEWTKELTEEPRQPQGPLATAVSEAREALYSRLLHYVMTDRFISGYLFVRAALGILRVRDLVWTTTVGMVWSPSLVAKRWLSTNGPLEASIAAMGG